MSRHRIKQNTLNAHHINSVSHLTGAKARKFERMEIDKMLRMDVREPEQSDWAWQTVFGPKVSLHFYIYYVKLNPVMAKDAYLTPRMNEGLYSLGKESICLTIDVTPGY